MLDAADVNISTSSVSLTARDLRLVSDNTLAAIADAGNANPDHAFRYDASLGGHVFNLSTRGLRSGQYVLSFYFGAERSFFYTVQFEVK